MYMHAEKEVNLPRLNIIHWTDRSGQRQVLKLLTQMSSKWQEIGGMIGIDGPVLRNYARRCLNDGDECIRDVARAWMEMCSEQVLYYNHTIMSSILKPAIHDLKQLCCRHVTK